MFSGLMGTIAQGAALGTGSAMAHRAVDSFMGPRTVHTEAAPAAAPAATQYESYPQQQQQQVQGACGEQIKAFTECLQRNQGDMNACQFYFDSMQQCKVNYGNAMM